MIILVMGVCGSGKTTIGSLLAQKLNWNFADADGFHSDENKAKMSTGQPLNDEDRYPWLCSIHHYMARLSANNQSGVVTCSALKRVYRDILQKGEIKTKAEKENHEKSQHTDIRVKPVSEEDICNTVQSIGNDVTASLSDSGLVINFVHLTGSVEVLQERMESRQGHFMPSALLQSQLHTLEVLEEDEKGLLVDVAEPVDDIVMKIIKGLNIL